MNYRRGICTEDINRAFADQNLLSELCILFEAGQFPVAQDTQTLKDTDLIWTYENFWARLDTAATTQTSVV